jgi:predicted ATP-grasp superfamily ATP-dependent carboligase
MKKILIFEPDSSQALAITKYIKKHSNFYIIGVIDKNKKFKNHAYDEVFIANVDSINEEEYDFILPMGAYSTYDIFSKYKKLDYCDIYFNNTNLIVYDKVKMLHIAQKSNIPTPKTYYCAKDVKEFPCFYKECFENGGGIRGIAKNIDELPKYNKLIYQEYISTPSTYGVGFLAKNGEILTYMMHKEVISYPQVGGSAVVIEKYEDNRLLEYTKTLLKELNYSGWGLAEFKYCNQREDFVFMEINAKFWASIEFMLRNNPDFLNYILGIDYVENKVNKIVFINRMLAFPFNEIVKNYKYLSGATCIIEHSITRQFIKKFIPNFFVNFLKSFLK